jgi:MSHA pilin protein MshD
MRVAAPWTRRRGTTLVEAVAAILTLGIAIPPLVGLFTEVASSTVDHTYQGVARAYANALMEEIVSKEFEDADESSGSFGTEEGARASFDDVDDFDGLSNSPPERITGADLDEYGGFTRGATVDNVTAADPDPATPAADGSTDFKRIRVTVTWTGGRGGELVLSTLRTKV